MRVHPESFVTSSVSVEHELRGAGACDTCCNRTVAGQEWMKDYVHSLIKLKLKYWTLPCQERFKFGAGDPVLCETAYFIPVVIHRACAFMRARKPDAADWQRHVASVGRTRFGLKNNVGIFPGAGDFQGKVMREIRARHLMVPLLPDSSWGFDGTFVPSEAAGPLVFSTNVTLEAFSVKRLPGSRTTRDLMMTSGKGLFKGSIVLLSLRTRACSGATCSNWTVSLVYSFLAFSVVWYCCSVRCVFLLLHGHRHPDRVFWRDCCRAHCHNSSHDRVLGRCHNLHHGIHPRGRGLRHGLSPGSCRSRSRLPHLCCGLYLPPSRIRSRPQSRGICQLVERVSLNNLTQTSSYSPWAGSFGAWDLTSRLRYRVKRTCLFALFKRLRSILCLSTQKKGLN